MNEAESCEGATLHCVCPKLIMLTIFRGPSGVGEGSTGRSTMKYHKTEADSTTFWLLWKGDEIEVLSAIGGFDEAAQNFKSDPGEIS